jgi:L-ribulose-5-phosphate 3-epimerase
MAANPEEEAMKTSIDRRRFLAASAGLAAAGLSVGFRPGSAMGAEPPSGGKLKKSWIVGRPGEEELKRIRDAGFEGVEATVSSRDEAPAPADAEKARAVAEKLGIRIHSVLRGWAEFNSTNPAKIQESFAVSEAALNAAAGYGADAVLLVPCRIGDVKMPRPWEFLIDFDEATGHIRTVTRGDNAPFANYIAAHNRSVDTSREAVKRLIPVAEKAKVVIALENVWNNLWVKPAIFRSFVESFRSPWVQAYFDIGNHVKYAPPEEWILQLAGLLSKIHVKDFRLNPSDPNGGGDFVEIRDGSVRWPVVRAALDRAGYAGWMTIEGGKIPLAEQAKRLDLIIAGK